MKIKVISGYKGTGPIRVALQRREVEGLCSGYESMRVTARSMLDAQGGDKLIRFFVHGKLEDPELRRPMRRRSGLRLCAKPLRRL